MIDKMRTKGRFIAGALVLAAALFATPAASPAESRPAAAPPPPCATGILVVWLSQSGGAAGTIYYDLHFTNLSSKSCTLAGFPGVSAIDLSGRQIGLAASRNSAAHAAKPAVITIAAGATATSLLGITEAGNYPPAICKMKTAAGVRVFPPNQTRAKTVPYPFSACAGKARILSVQAVQKGFNPR